VISTISKKEYDHNALTQIFNDWKLVNSTVNLSNNLNLTNNDLQILSNEMLDENKAILPELAEIPITDYNLFLLQDHVSKYGVLGYLKRQKIEFGEYIVILLESQGIELGRFDWLSSKIYFGRILKLFPSRIIKYLIFHELLHTLGYNHGYEFKSIMAQYPNNQSIEIFLYDFVKYLTTNYIVKFKENYYFRIKKPIPS